MSNQTSTVGHAAADDAAANAAPAATNPDEQGPPASAAAVAPPVSGDGASIPGEFLKLEYRPDGAEGGVRLERDDVLAWRDRGDVVVVVAAKPVAGGSGKSAWRGQKLFASKAVQKKKAGA